MMFVMHLEAGAHNLLQGTYVNVCRMLLQDCVRLGHDIRQLEFKVSSCVYYASEELYLESKVSN